MLLIRCRTLGIYWGLRTSQFYTDFGHSWSIPYGLRQWRPGTRDFPRYSLWIHRTLSLQSYIGITFTVCFSWLSLLSQCECVRYNSLLKVFIVLERFGCGNRTLVRGSDIWFWYLKYLKYLISDALSEISEISEIRYFRYLKKDWM